jgi:hypothetical protein
MRVVGPACHPVMPDLCIFGPEMNTGEECLLTRLASAPSRSHFERENRDEAVVLRRLQQAFLGQRFLHLRPGADAGLVGHQVGEMSEIPFHPFGP